VGGSRQTIGPVPPPTTRPLDATNHVLTVSAPLGATVPEAGSSSDETPVTAFDALAVVANLPTRPGVYRMLDAKGCVIYVGKARNLKSRVGSYFRADQPHPKVVALVQQVCGIDVTITNSDTEALLLEFNLIKKFRPHYNILLKDDKSFPFLYLSTTHEFPRLSFYRGSRRIPGKFFGPYPSTPAVRDTLLQLQKVFRLRPCEDSYFANRSRACLQYQIQRCSGPCVGHVTKEDYATDVDAAVRVLEGRNDAVALDIAKRMDDAAQVLHYEKAATLRDQLSALKAIQAKQIVTADPDLECDAIAVTEAAGEYCIALMFIRGGQNLGTTHYFTRAALADLGEVTAAFLAQHYLTHAAPSELLISEPIPDSDVLAEALSAHAGQRVSIHCPVRGLKTRWVAMAHTNAVGALKMRLATHAGIAAQLAQLGTVLGLVAAPRRIECFDVSHTRGEATVASCVVFGVDGPIKADYRRFNIEGLAPGDDYGAMRQALMRRYRRLKAGEAAVPDVLLIDGGPGQLTEAAEMLVELGVSVQAVVGVAKGVERRPGKERLFILGRDEPLVLGGDSSALHVVQRVRDEAHRFAIAGHRARRGKARQSSVLEEVKGLGPQRRRELLKHFGGLQGIMGAGVDDLARVHGISPRLAESIYERLHPGG